MRELVPFFSKRSALERPFFEEFDRIVNEFFGKDLFPSLETKHAFPKLNVYQKNNKLCIDAFVGELPKDKIQVDIKDDVLTIRGDSCQDTDIEEDDYLCREISRRAFERSIRLPEGVDTSKPEAKKEEGILKISFPLAIVVKENAKKIEIK